MKIDRCKLTFAFFLFQVCAPSRIRIFQFGFILAESKRALIVARVARNHFASCIDTTLFDCNMKCLFFSVMNFTLLSGYFVK